MKYVLVLLTLLPLCWAGIDPHKQRMLKQNKTPKEAGLTMNDVCDECKAVVREFDDDMKDPTKVAELKNLLTVLCDSMKGEYVAMCKLAVDHLDDIIKYLQPYLGNPTRLCSELHMCGSGRMDKIHRMALLYARKYMNRYQGDNDMFCDECEFAVTELKTLLEEKDVEQKIQQFLSQDVCSHLGQYQGSCDELVEQFLPELFKELGEMLENSKQVCTDLGMCTSDNAFDHMLVRGQPLHPADNTYFNNAVDETQLVENANANSLQSFWRILTRLQTKNGVYMSCFECELALDAVLAELQSDTLQTSVASDLRELLCDHLPSAYTDQCQDFLNLYLKSMLSMTVDQLSAGQLCRMMHLCTAKTLKAVMRVSDGQKASVACETCKSIADFARREMADRTFQEDIERELERTVCRKLPTGQDFCENAVQTYIPKMMLKLQTIFSSDTICKDDLHMCTDELLQEIGL